MANNKLILSPKKVVVIFFRQIAYLMLGGLGSIKQSDWYLEGLIDLTSFTGLGSQPNSRYCLASVQTIIRTAF